MAKVSPARTNFNGGVFSELTLGRVDTERYSTAMRRSHNYVAVAQGPAIGRSGTYFKAKVFDKTKRSHLIPFKFSDEQALQLEFSDLKMRIISDDGVLTTGAARDIVNVITVSPFQFRSAQLVSDGIAVGDQVAFAGFANSENVNGAIGTVTAIAANDITVDIPYYGATGVRTGSTGTKVFTLTTPYSHDHVSNLRAVQDLDVLYLFCRKGDTDAGYKPQKLSRLGATNWTIADFEFIGGPYLPEPATITLVTPSADGAATEVHTTNVGVNGTASASSEDSGATQAWHAFDANSDTFWQPSTNQVGTLQYRFTSGAKVIEGYTIHAAAANDSSGSSASDKRPRAFKFQGSSDGITWITLDEQVAYALWENNRTQYIKTNNTTAYEYYRLDIKSLEASGTIEATVDALRLREAGTQTLTLTFGSIADVNGGAGFTSLDVGRNIRLYQQDGFWRDVRITAITSTSVVTVKLLGEPLYNTEIIRRWRLGVASEVTGWPVTGAFTSNDRLALGGIRDYPTMLVMSEPAAYDRFAPTDPGGAVTDANGILLSPKTRNASPIRWIKDAAKGVAVGFGSAEYIIKEATTSNPFSARNAKASKETERGSAFVEPVQVDTEILFVGKDKRTLREFGYVFQSDGFKAPSMSVYASHLGVPEFEQIVYAADPHSIVWCRMGDGSLIGFTYNREENVLAWHTHQIAGTGVEVESLSVIPNEAGTNDDLWLIVKRTVNATTERYIEKLMPFWDFNHTLDDAFYVDSGLSSTLGAPSTVVYGLTHLEGQAVCGLADGIHFGVEDVVTVTNGAITLPFEATNITVGLAFEAVAETSNLEAGAADGTAQGKVKRIHNVSFAVWASYKGQVGVYGDDRETYYYDDVEYLDVSELEAPDLFSGILGPFVPEQGYGKRGSVSFRRTYPYPFNIIGIYPQLNTQDR